MGAAGGVLGMAGARLAGGWGHVTAVDVGAGGLG